MKRRNALKSVFTSLGATISIPIWANNWNSQTIKIAQPIFTAIEENTLIAVVEAIIPEGEVLGAKSLGVPQLIQKIVADCMEKKQQIDFKNGLDNIEKLSELIHSKPFVQCDQAQKLSLLKTLETSADNNKKAFFAQLKNLTIQCYTNSEYVQTKFLKYNMAPGHYYGCVAV